MKFTWNVENISSFKVGENAFSEPFVLGGYLWRIVLYPRGDRGENYVSIYLEAEQMQTADNSNEWSNGRRNEWSRDVKFNLFVFNQLHPCLTVEEDFDCKFDSTQKSWGFKSSITVDEFHNPEKGFILEDVCIVGAELQTSLTTRSETNHLLSSEVHRQLPILKTISSVSPLVGLEPTKHNDPKLFSPSMEEIMDFSSVGQLEEMYSHNHSLNEPPLKRSRKFTGLAFEALGRVLYFLKTRKVKDMNERASKDLQVLWEELKKFGFDLAWLEPHVQSLGMRSYVEKALEVEKLKGDVANHEMETDKLKAKLAAAQGNLDRERNLLKEKGFEERDLDSELGCGSWRPKT
ncbi:hypothetical protein KIW84_031122 [Lathyrus oleraceus]|uniref:MATH domain-containing protein n=1 Tax=Pisum sativum TaxID=3888 RepID=A0A9D4XUY8_PEA|nr:hypothetical protein KIW84_031122 [Pisum sativum]